MSTQVKKLLAEATPLPWDIAPGRYVGWIAESGDDGWVGFAYRKPDRDLVMHAVNRLPDYEAAVEALEGLLDLIDSWEVDGERTDEQYVEAHAALACLDRS